jgi:hypothetical protein
MPKNEWVNEENFMKYRNIISTEGKNCSAELHLKKFQKKVVFRNE